MSLEFVTIPMMGKLGRTHDQQKSPLFKLPAEIRLSIFEHVLYCQKDDLGVLIARRLTNTRFVSVLSLLQTCQRVLREAEGIFYSVNRLFIEDVEPLLAAIGPRRRNAIARVTLPAADPAVALSELQNLQAAPRLRSLHLLRVQSIKYLNIRTWAMMAPQIITEIKKMQHLLTLNITTPEADGLNDYDKTRRAKLVAIDARLYAAIQ